MLYGLVEDAVKCKKCNTDYVITLDYLCTKGGKMI